MLTPTCCGTVIENWALGNKFYVCTECHQEVTPNPDPNEVRIWSSAPGFPTPISVEEVSSTPSDFDDYPWMGD